MNKLGPVQIVGCVGSPATFRSCTRRAPSDCDWLEVRLDLTGLCDGRWLNWCAAAQSLGRPVLLTLRSASEGGRWNGTEAERMALYREALPVVNAVDMEIRSRGFATLATAARKHRVRVIGSFHDFTGTPSLSKLARLEARGRSLGADIVKIATTVRHATDLATLFALPIQANGPICVLGMGERGAISRVALPCAGSCLAYGSLVAATAPGQPTCRRLARDLARLGVRSRTAAEK